MPGIRPCSVDRKYDAGERLNGIQEVSGSIPLISTTGKQKEACFRKKASLSHFNHTRHRIDISQNANQVPPQGVPTGTPFFHTPEMRLTVRRIFSRCISVTSTARSLKEVFTSSAELLLNLSDFIETSVITTNLSFPSSPRPRPIRSETAIWL